MQKNKAFIISLGGSLIVPNGGIDWKFLKKFRELILGQINDGKSFFIITGGGATCRNYNDAASRVIKVAPEDLDWLGIHATRLNAHLLRTIFFDIAHPEVIKNPTFRMSTEKKLLVAGGWKPGWSTDYVATMIAQEYEVKSVINLSNIDYVFDKDPRKYKDANKIEKIDWKSFRKLVGNKWIPGMNSPFDPIASQKAQTLGLEVVIMNGKNLANLKNYLQKGNVKGTVISD
jgi:uridylate kinase